MELAEAMATIELQRGHIAALELTIASRDEALAQLRAELSARDFEIARLKRQLFGDRKERVVGTCLRLCPGWTSRRATTTRRPKEQEPPKRRCAATPCASLARGWSWSPAASTRSTTRSSRR
ncbi:MAG: hypothetical protein R3A52_24390 [Polyangiales bacterium]